MLGPVKGQWLSPTGDLFEERMIPVLLTCSREQIAQVADFTAKHYEQLAVFYYLVSNQVFIRHYEPARNFERAN